MSFTILDMDKYTVSQRVKIIEAYYENGCSKRNAYRALRDFLELLINQLSVQF